MTNVTGCAPGAGQEAYVTQWPGVCSTSAIGCLITSLGELLRPVVEPGVQGVDVGRAAEVERVEVAGLVQPDLARHAAGGQGREPADVFVRLHVGVVEAVDQEDLGMHLAHVAQVVAIVPVGVVDRPGSAERATTGR